jgi:hypothetical protein
MSGEVICIGWPSRVRLLYSLIAVIASLRREKYTAAVLVFEFILTLVTSPTVSKSS